MSSTSNIFGLIVAGRPVQTEMVALSETKFLAEIPEADNINHIVVFMTGVMPFPAGMGGAVHFYWPETGWTLLGFISNDKPSVIFKITGLKAGAVSDNLFGSHPTHIAQIGISVESMEDLMQQSPASNTAPSTTSTFAEFTQKIVENFFNFVSSFAVSQSQMTPLPNETFIPSKAVEQWYNNTKSKLQSNPNFWKN